MDDWSGSRLARAALSPKGGESVQCKLAYRRVLTGTVCLNLKRRGCLTMSVSHFVRRRKRFVQFVMQMRSSDPEVRRRAEERRRRGQEFKRRREEADLELAEVAKAAGVALEDLIAYEVGTLPPEEYQPPDFVERIEKALLELSGNY